MPFFGSRPLAHEHTTLLGADKGVVFPLSTFFSGVSWSCWILGFFCRHWRRAGWRTDGQLGWALRRLVSSCAACCTVLKALVQGKTKLTVAGQIPFHSGASWPCQPLSCFAGAGAGQDEHHGGAQTVHGAALRQHHRAVPGQDRGAGHPPAAAGPRGALR